MDSESVPEKLSPTRIVLHENVCSIRRPTNERSGEPSRPLNPRQGAYKTAPATAPFRERGTSAALVDKGPKPSLAVSERGSVTHSRHSVVFHGRPAAEVIFSIRLSHSMDGFGNSSPAQG